MQFLVAQQLNNLRDLLQKRALSKVSVEKLQRVELLVVQMSELVQDQGVEANQGERTWRMGWKMMTQQNWKVGVTFICNQMTGLELRWVVYGKRGVYCFCDCYQIRLFVLGCTLHSACYSCCCSCSSLWMYFWNFRWLFNGCNGLWISGIIVALTILHLVYSYNLLPWSEVVSTSSPLFLYFPILAALLLLKCLPLLAWVCNQLWKLHVFLCAIV